MSEAKEKLKLAVYWAASCGGCCVSVLDVHETVLTVLEHAEFVFWPIALDTKYKDLEGMEDGAIDVTLFNGAIRNSENRHIAEVLRAKSKVLVAYGACAYMGGIPGLANLYSRDEILNRVYLESESTENPGRTLPVTKYKVPEGTLTLPAFYRDVYTLDQVVDVDYYIPGCPPQSERLVEVLMLVFTGAELPPKGSVVGAGENGQCDECERKKTDEGKKIKRFYRPWEVKDDGETCLIEQGIICMGPATRTGCGVRCLKANSPCRGCYGPPPDVPDPGAKMMSAISTMLDETEEEAVMAAADSVDDPAGTFYRFSVPSSMLRRKMV